MAASHTEGKIYDALIAHLQQFALPAGMEIAYPGTNFPGLNSSGQPKPKPAAGYIRVDFRVNTPINPHISGAALVRMGFFMATVCWPVAEGIVKPTDLASRIRDHFAFNDAGDDRRIIDHEGLRILIGIDPAPRVGDADQE